jgi:hypothetical protein
MAGVKVPVHPSTTQALRALRCARPGCDHTMAEHAPAHPTTCTAPGCSCGGMLIRSAELADAMRLRS